VVVTSGNHDSAARLGFQAPLLAEGIHVLTDPLAIGTPVTIDGVHFYGIPYLEPALVRHLWPGETLRSQQQVMRHAMGLVNADRQERGGVSVAIAHCFAAGVEATPQLEREVRHDLTQGTLDVVPLADLAGPDYVALGHIHGRAELAPHIRYSGAPLHYSFGEADKPRGSWLVELSEAGFSGATWLDLPVPRGHATLRGTLDDVLETPGHDDEWVRAILTDRMPPKDPMQKLRARFPYCATIEYQPERVDAAQRTYRDRVGRGAPDPQVVDDFLDHVRAGEGASEAERALIADVVAEIRAGEQA